MKLIKAICKIIYIVFLVKIAGFTFIPTIYGIESSYYNNMSFTSVPNKSNLPLSNEYFSISRFTESAIINKFSCNTIISNINSYLKQIPSLLRDYNIIKVNIRFLSFLMLLLSIYYVFNDKLVGWAQKKDGKKRLSIN